ncbi:MAG: sodium:alanine symporter family protein [Bacteroidetes bacterium]|nr:sodium:alanine symporter family protein [Bacteroidota bacterium]MCY4205805.1 sodium:alanine symporter family protein [Bacteroidota bacterium]
MEVFLGVQQFIDNLLAYPLLVMLVGTGLFLTFRLGFIQFRQFGHGIKVATGKYDDPEDAGDVSHFQALTTALSATVGIGNIAGVALAIHWGGPGAIFWMWITALLGMCTKYTEVTLAQRYRVVNKDGSKLVGTVSGGPMYYIEYGLGKSFKPLAMLVAGAMILTAFMTGNAIQANTVSDLMNTEFAIPTWVTGGLTSAVVALVILGGISRIGRVTGILAPVMGLLYVFGGVVILAINYNGVFPALASIFTEAFNPTAGVAGTGIGILLQTILWGIRRGLFSNEAGQGSAPIAHSAAKTQEPVSEGAVALLEPFIDTIVICTITALVVLTTGVWKDTVNTELLMGDGDLSYTEEVDGRYQSVTGDIPAELRIDQGIPVTEENAGVMYSWHEVPVEQFFIDRDQTMPFTGVIDTKDGVAISALNQTQYKQLYGPAVENGAPMTALAFEQGLGDIGKYLVILCVFLFAISTAISWSYYGDRCSMYLFGKSSILPYKIVFVILHFVGAVAGLNTIWGIGDTAIAILTIPNVLALVMLSGIAKKLTDDYFSAFKPGMTREEYLSVARDRVEKHKSGAEL